MSAFGCRAEVIQGVAECPLLARSGHQIRVLEKKHMASGEYESFLLDRFVLLLTCQSVIVDAYWVLDIYACICDRLNVVAARKSTIPSSAD